MKISKQPAAKPLAQLDQDLQHFSHDDPAVRPSSLWMRSVTWSLIGATAFGVGWLALARTEEIVVATGKLEPIGSSTEIQMPIGGVAKQILVKEGQAVKPGQVLLQLDTDASRQRLTSLDKGIAYKRQQLSLKEEELQRYLQINNAETSMLSKQLELDREILGRLDSLSKSGATPELQYLQQRNKVQEMQGRLQQAQSERLRQSAILEQQIRQIRSELADLTSQQAEASMTLRYQAVRSPVAGTVFDLRPTAPGFTATTATPVMKIVPQKALEGSIEIDSANIGFVRVGMPVDVSVDSFPASDFGVLEGKIRRISSDALEPDPSAGKQTLRFPAQVKLDSQELRLKSGKALPLQAGMAITANIKLRPVSYLQLLLGAFRDKAQALQEI